MNWFRLPNRPVLLAYLPVSTAGVVLLAFAGCSSSTASIPTLAPDAAYQVQGGQPSAEVSPTIPSSPGAAGANPVPAGVGGPSPAAVEIRLTLDPSAALAQFAVREQLAGRAAESDAIGTTSDVSGTLVLLGDGSFAQAQSAVQVNLDTLKTDSRQRDSFIKRNTLQTSQFPTAAFVPTRLDGLTLPLPTSGERTFKLPGNLTMHNTTSAVTWDVAARFSPTEVTGSAKLAMTLPDFGMQKPSLASVLSIQDQINLQIDFTARRQGG